MLILSLQDLDKHIINKLSSRHPFILHILSDHLSRDFLLKHLKVLLYNQPKSHILEFDIDNDTERVLTNKFFNYCNDNFDLEGFDINQNVSFVHSIKQIVEILSGRNSNINFNLILGYKDRLEIKSLYSLLAKLRNLREELKARKFNNIIINIFVIGFVPIYDLIEYCRKLSVSSVVEDKIIFNTYSFRDLIYYNILPTDDDLFLEYFYELTKGCPYLTEKLLGALENSSFNSLDEINSSYSKVVNSDIYKTLLIEGYNDLSDNLRNYITELLNLRLLKFKSLNNNIEILILSGLVRIWKEYDYYIMSLRNWSVEMILRNYLIKIKNNEVVNHEISNNLSFIPPLFVTNGYCFQIINEIEVLLKNFLSIYLEKNFNYREIQEHPLKFIPYPSKKNEKRIKKFFNYYDFCENQNYRLSTNPDLNLNKSLYTYLYFSDILEILFNSKIKELNNKPLITLFNDIFNNPDELFQKLSRLKSIRDAVAHSNTVHVKTVDEVLQIKKYIYKKLTVDLTK